MKFLPFFASILIIVAQNSFAQSRNDKGPVVITYPIEGSVLQRNTDNRASFTITAQAGYGFENEHRFRYNIKKLNPISGEIILGSAVVSGQFTSYPFPLPNNLDVKMLSAQISNLEAGWYELNIQIFMNDLNRLTPNNIPEFVGSRTIKFGIGDIYVIAGQSNVQGFQEIFDAKLIPHDPSLVDSELPDACRVFSYFQGQFETPELIGFPHVNHSKS